MPASPTSILDQDEAVRYAACGPIWVMMLIGTPTLERMQRSESTLAHMAARHPAGFPTLTWILPSAGVMMDAPAREAAAQATKRYETSIRAMANVVEGTGFWAATVRAVLSGLTLLASSRAPQGTWAEVGPALEWLMPFTTADVDGRTWDRAQLEAGLLELRRG